MKVKQTAGRDSMGDFAPAFARLNDDVLFGEVWSEETLSLKTRSLLTVSALIGKGMVDESLRYHLETAKRNGVTREEMAETLTHLAFYAGWPNAWAAFRSAERRLPRLFYGQFLSESAHRSRAHRVHGKRDL